MSLSSICCLKQIFLIQCWYIVVASVYLWRVYEETLKSWDEVLKPFRSGSRKAPKCPKTPVNHFQVLRDCQVCLWLIWMALSVSYSQTHIPKLHYDARWRWPAKDMFAWLVVYRVCEQRMRWSSTGSMSGRKLFTKLFIICSRNT